MSNFIINKLFKFTEEKVVKRPLPSPMKMAFDTKADAIVLKPLNMRTPEEKAFLKTYVEMEQARLGIKLEKLKQKK